MSGRNVAIVQARMGSGRLPGKVLAPIAGLPAILHVVRRLRCVRGLDAIVVSTPAGPEEAPLHDLLRREGVDFHAFEGEPNDLLGRYVATGEAWQADVVLMVDGDCPLVDPDTAERMLGRLAECPEAEYVRIAPWTLEGGMACLRLDTFRRIDRDAAPGPYREHATLRILERPHEFAIVEIPVDPAFSDPADAHRLWLDTPADHRFLECVFERLQRDGSPGSPLDLREVVALLRREPALRELNAHVRQKDPFAASSLVAFLPPAAEPARFAEIERLAAERHRLGVRRLVGPDALGEARRLGVRWAVMAPGDPRAAARSLRVLEAPTHLPPERVCEELVRMTSGSAEEGSAWSA